MKVFSYSEASQNFSRLLNIAKTEEVEIRRGDGTVFFLTAKRKTKTSPFDIPGLKTRATTQDILDAIQDSRMN